MTLTEATTIVLTQDSDTAPRKDDTTLASLLFTTTRSQEAATDGLSNEDYITFRHDERRLALIVCDGVGQSFFGELAARFLGDKLLDWLWKLPPGAASEGQKHAEKLFNNLHAWTGPATILVQAHRLPKNRKHSLLNTALERKRKQGSASVFACALVEVVPGAKDLSVLAFWLGNTRLRFWDSNGTELPLADEQSSNEQWTTSKGPVNSDVVHHVALPTLRTHKIARMTLHTDGLHTVADQLADLSISRLERLLKQLADDPASDDSSLLDATFVATFVNTD